MVSFTLLFDDIKISILLWFVDSNRSFNISAIYEKSFLDFILKIIYLIKIIKEIKPVKNITRFISRLA